MFPKNYTESIIIAHCSNRFFILTKWEEAQSVSSSIQTSSTRFINPGESRFIDHTSLDLTIIIVFNWLIMYFWDSEMENQMKEGLAQSEIMSSSAHTKR